MRIEKCKLRIAGLARAASQICNLHSSILNFQLSLLLGAVAVLACGVLFAPSLASEERLFSIEQGKDRTGHGRFPHDQKEHIKVQCADCHLAGKEKPRNTDQPMSKDFPHSTCIRCHNFAAEFFKSAFGGPSRFCGVCHEPGRISKADKGLRAGVFPKPQISDFEDAFSHKAHRKTLLSDLRIAPVSNPPYGSQFMPGASPRCTDCHQQVKRARTDTKEFKTEESHRACFVCHGGSPSEPRRVAAETFPYANDCKVCHELSSAGVRRRTLFGSIRDFKHDDHDLDIRPKKRSDFPLPTATDRLCSECHKLEQVETLNALRLPAAGYCDTCHISRRPGLPDKLSAEILNKLGRD